MKTKKFFVIRPDQLGLQAMTYNLLQAPVSQNKSGVNQAVQMLCSLLNICSCVCFLIVFL